MVESVEVVALDGEGMDVAATVKTKSFFGKVAPPSLAVTASVVLHVACFSTLFVETAFPPVAFLSTGS